MIVKRADLDILIIGSGAAGIAASIEAVSRGARVKIVEQAPSWGGTAIISGGGVFMVDTSLQRELGIQDSIELASEDWERWSNGTADMEWAHYYIERSCTNLYEWTKKLGVRWVEVKLEEGNSVPRWHRPQGRGREILECIHREAIRVGSKDWAFSTNVKKLLRDESGRVSGVELQQGTGTKTIKAKAVLVATGGFCSNHDMVQRYLPGLKGKRILVGGGPGAFGSGLRLVSEVGGTHQNLEDIWIYVYATPDPDDRSGKRGLVIRGIKQSIWVNSEGRRFHDELRSGGATGTTALLRQEHPTAWAILDSSMVKDIEVSDPRYRDGSDILTNKILRLLKNSFYIKKNTSFEGLAMAMNVDPVKFQKTIDVYHSYLDGGLAEDPEFGKNLRDLKKFNKPPFYAVQFFPLARKNLGGVRTDLTCRVLDERGNAIPGLYAAGEVAGMAGGHINGAAGLEGTMLGPSIFSGRVAGSWAAHHLGLGRGFS